MRSRLKGGVTNGKRKKIRIFSMEHYDQKESNGNAAKKYILEFTGKVNSEWLWEIISEALLKKQELKNFN